MKDGLRETTEEEEIEAEEEREGEGEEGEGEEEEDNEELIGDYDDDDPYGDRFGASLRLDSIDIIRISEKQFLERNADDQRMDGHNNNDSVNSCFDSASSSDGDASLSDLSVGSVGSLGSVVSHNTESQISSRSPSGTPDSGIEMEIEAVA